MEDECEELQEQALAYILNGFYPDECTDNRKRAIRRKAGKFVHRDGEFFYKHKVKSKVYL